MYQLPLRAHKHYKFVLNKNIFDSFSEPSTVFFDRVLVPEIQEWLDTSGFEYSVETIMEPSATLKYEDGSPKRFRNTYIVFRKQGDAALFKLTWL